MFSYFVPCQAKILQHFFINPLFRHSRSISFENFTNNDQKMDKYSDVCEIMIALLVFEIQDYESGFRCFFATHFIIF